MVVGSRNESVFLSSEAELIDRCSMTRHAADLQQLLLLELLQQLQQILQLLQLLHTTNNVCSMSINTEQEAQQSLGKANHTTYVRSPAFNVQSRKKNDLSEVRQFHACYVNETLSQKLQ